MSVLGAASVSNQYVVFSVMTMLMCARCVDDSKENGIADGRHAFNLLSQGVAFVTQQFAQHLLWK